MFDEPELGAQLAAAQGEWQPMAAAPEHCEVLVYMPIAAIGKRALAYYLDLRPYGGPAQNWVYAGNGQRLEMEPICWTPALGAPSDADRRRYEAEALLTTP